MSLSWLTVAWSINSASSAILGLLHLLLWWKDRGSPTYLLAALMALGATGNAFTELMLLHAESVRAYAVLLQWLWFFVYTLLMAMVWFIYVQLGTARRWPALIISLLWTIALVINFVSPDSLIYLKIDALVQLETYWGESFSTVRGSPNPWNILADVGVLMILIYVVDAALRCWRQGNKRRAGITGGSIVVFLLFGGIHSMLVDRGVVATPYMVSFAFLAIVAALSYELVSTAVKVRRYAQQLEFGEQRWQTFLAKVELAVVGVNTAGNVNFANPYVERITGFAAADLIGRPIGDLLAPADSKESATRLQQALQTGLRPRSTWTLISATGESRKLQWSTVKINQPDGSPAGFLSIGEDITERLEAHAELQSIRREMERLARANVLGELSSALAHELNQPLAAILSNAQAARRFLEREPADIQEVREILDDIVRDDKHAGQVIHSLRNLLRGGEIERSQISMNEAIDEVLQLLKSELEGQSVVVAFEADPRLPPVLAGRVQIQQVILNLVVNAIHALRQNPADQRRLMIRTEVLGDKVRTKIQDNGPGFKEEDLPRLFTAFFTQHTEGLGIGLGICYRIISAHGGQIRAANTPGGGAGVFFSLPITATEARSA